MDAYIWSKSFYYAKAYILPEHFHYSAKLRRWPNVGLPLAYRLRR